VALAVTSQVTAAKNSFMPVFSEIYVENFWRYFPATARAEPLLKLGL